MCQCGATVAQLICNQWVAGSIPVTGSMRVSGSVPLWDRARFFLGGAPSGQRPFRFRFVSICNTKMGNSLLIVTDQDRRSRVGPFISICNSREEYVYLTVTD